ncbi:hypothetical protein [Burkholderia oklahomensis]|uniref:Uncharacterized protein n=1 Tax=Burkholderia oklahomensis TaxID=342113 RepID=A0AAI8BBD0_9BURK|nr:hypothetical protein [Burkholderia oklahomensis]AIO69116.1 hypothetical protein DM82_5667 [Burkholderia oklahomensis]AJX36146.1 hypothetical protein BG90_4967 [Burkholderia oklahomensis C6786]MBI0363149.1 hypothetical protein [Burkholderia oklahomensis]QPS40692.1 hypothetical protein I6G57_20405 [Burkholderia oklahomensis]SUY27259.1 Uncharacterised protein [Burkholderia oklahomensis]
MNAETVTNLLAEFDDLASKSENQDVQSLIRAMKLHAQLMNVHLAKLEALFDRNSRSTSSLEKS